MFENYNWWYEVRGKKERIRLEKENFAKKRNSFRLLVESVRRVLWVAWPNTWFFHRIIASNDDFYQMIFGFNAI